MKAEISKAGKLNRKPEPEINPIDKPAHSLLDRPSSSALIRRAERHLSRTDPIMKRLIARHGSCPLAEREFEPFHMLANSIISQ
jgi:3-methyladenine DNA glycosylase/8-oxoguanine DNA glycosylase